MSTVHVLMIAPPWASSKELTPVQAFEDVADAEVEQGRMREVTEYAGFDFATVEVSLTRSKPTVESLLVQLDELQAAVHKLPGERAPVAGVEANLAFDRIRSLVLQSKV